jgi:hypothetical protein
LVDIAGEGEMGGVSGVSAIGEEEEEDEWGTIEHQVVDLQSRL